MTSVSNINFAPNASTEAMPAKAAPDSEKPFDSLLPASPVEETAPALPKAVKDFSDASEMPERKPGVDDAPKDVHGPDQKKVTDPLLLSSCLAVWQILPPPVPAPALSTTAGGEGQTVDTKSFVPGAPPNVNGTIALNGLANPAASMPTPDTRVGTNPSRSSPAAQTPDSASPKASPPTAPAPPAQIKDTPTTDVDPSAVVATAGQVATLLHPETNHAPKPVRAAKPSENNGHKGAPVGPELPRPVADGILVAKEQRAMSAPIFHNLVKTAAATIAGDEAAPKTPAVPSREALSETKAFEPAGHDGSQEGMTNGQHEHPSPDSNALPNAPEVRFETGDLKTTANEKLAASDTAQVVRDIERAVDRMRAQGSQRMEMRLPLRDGGEVVVKLRIEQGEVRATFQSASEGLRQALETGWSQLSQNSSERAAKAAPAMFESPSLQHGMGGFQQSPHQREHRASEGDTETAFAPSSLQPASKHLVESRLGAGAATQTASLELYA